MLLQLQVTLQTPSFCERELISRGEASVPLGVNGTDGSWIQASDPPITRRTPYPLGQRIGEHIPVPGVTTVPILGISNSNSFFRGLLCILYLNVLVCVNSTLRTKINVPHLW